MTSAERKLNNNMALLKEYLDDVNDYIDMDAEMYAYLNKLYETFQSVVERLDELSEEIDEIKTEIEDIKGDVELIKDRLHI